MAVRFFDGNYKVDQIPGIPVPSSSTETRVRSFGFGRGLLTFTKPRHIFGYYVASLYKCADPSELWIEHTDVSRKCCQKFTEIRHSIVFECCLARSFRRYWAPGISRS